MSNNNIFAWGRNNYQQVNYQTDVNTNFPIKSNTYVNWKQISAGNFHAVSIKDDNTLWTWGRNNYGQLGNNSISDNELISKISTSNWLKISCGYNHTLAIKEDGTLWSWGKDKWGRLGHDGNNTRPVQIGTDTNWKEISGGGYHSLAIKEDGTLWSWGWNNFGQLGLEDNNDRNIPVQIGTDTNWKYINSGNFHTLAIKEDGTLWSFGRNNFGQLGLEDNNDRNIPVQIGTDTNWKTINAGDFISFGIKEDGTLWSWGWNGFGQLGLFDTDNRNIPVQIGIDTNWKYINAGRLHVSGIKEDGTIWTWGRNNYGQLGLEDNIDRHEPIQVTFSNELLKWLDVNSSQNFTITIRDSNLGLLRVILNPDRVVSKNAQWRIQGENTWYNSTSSLVLDSGTYILEFKDVDGWITPDNKEVIIEEGKELIETISYDALPSLITVNITPDDIGGQWRLQGTLDWKDSNDTIEVEANIYHTIEFKILDRWYSPASISLKLEEGEEVVENVEYEARVGVLKVILYPSDVISRGAQWRIQGENTWYNHNNSLSLNVGTYTLEFKDVEGWITPDNKEVIIEESDFNTQHITYNSIPGTLTVNINPNDIGGQWRLQNSSTWYNHNDTVSLEPGTYIIILKEVNGWIKPDSISVYIESGIDITETFTYEESLIGTLTVNINPNDIGGQWRIDGSNLWYNSGKVLSLDAGNYTIISKEVNGWTIPDNKEVTVIKNSNITEVLEYDEIIPDTGSLEVIINPEDVRFAGAQWRIYGGGLFGEEDWNFSSNIVNLEVGSYIIQFKDVEGWIKPDSIEVTIEKDINETRTVEYEEIIADTGSLSVTINPEGVRLEGAKWKLYGEDVWYNSDEIITLNTGSYTLIFKEIEGWYLPDSVNITINKNEETVKIVEYNKVETSITANLFPEDAVEAGAQWTLTDAETSIQVYINPDEAIDDGGQWTLDYTGPADYDYDGPSVSYKPERPGDELPEIPDKDTGKGKITIRGSYWRIFSPYVSNSDWIAPDTFLEVPEYEYTIQFKKEDGYELITNQIVEVKENDILQVTVTPLKEIPSSKDIKDASKLAGNGPDLIDSFGSLLKGVRSQRKDLEGMVKDILKSGNDLPGQGFGSSGVIDNILDTSRNSINSALNDTKYGVGEYTGTCLDSVFNNTRRLVNDIFRFLGNLFPDNLLEFGMLGNLLNIKGLINNKFGEDIRRLLELLECLSDNNIMKAGDWDDFNSEIIGIAGDFKINSNGSWNEDEFVNGLDMPSNVKEHLNSFKDKALSIPDEVINNTKEVKDIVTDNKFDNEKMDWHLY